jgi:hypothetical protein
VSKPRRKYNSPKAIVDALERRFRFIDQKYVEVPDPPKTLYHYCREDVLLAILCSGNLWASDVLFMNDEKEVGYSYDLINRIVAAAGEEEGVPKYPFKSRNAREIWSRFWTHITCFSSTSELPSQWYGYASAGTGCAIGIDQKSLRTWCNERGVSLVPMIYNRSRQEEMLTDFFEAERSIRISRKPTAESGAREVFRWTAIKYLASLALTLKDEGWQSERETRILIIRPTNSTDFVRKVRKDGVGYFELPIVDLATEIVLGPQCDLDSEELAAILDRAGLNSVNVRRSSCQCPPFSS